MQRIVCELSIPLAPTIYGGLEQSRERAALVVLGQAAASSGWVFSAGWLSESHHCDWDLVGCSHDGFVTALTLSFNNLTGVLPEDLGVLTRLQVLDVESNMLQGAVPAALGSLASLKQLGIGGNNFTGVLPDDICHVPAIGGPACDLSGSSFTCPIPECAKRCGASCGASVVASKFVVPIGGGMPASGTYIGTHLPLAKGRVDEHAVLISLAQASTVAGWRVKGGWLTNTPHCDWDFVACDSEQKVKLLTLGFNNLTGTIPDTLAHLPRLQNLDLVFNKLEGSVPDVFGSLAGLLQLGLGGNALSGAIPDSLCGTIVAHHNACNCFGNNFSCPVPTCLEGHCKVQCQQLMLV